MEIKDKDVAQSTFDALLEQAGHCSLWFYKPLKSIDITDPKAGVILEKICLPCSRDEWIITRRLKKWRSQNIR